MRRHLQQTFDTSSYDAKLKRRLGYCSPEKGRVYLKIRQSSQEVAPIFVW